MKVDGPKALKDSQGWNGRDKGLDGATAISNFRMLHDVDIHKPSSAVQRLSNMYLQKYLVHYRLIDSPQKCFLALSVRLSTITPSHAVPQHCAIKRNSYLTYSTAPHPQTNGHVLQRGGEGVIAH